MMKALLSIVCGMLLAGCSAVSMKEPFPETKLSEEDRERLEGTWILENEEVYYLTFSSNMVPVMAWVDDEGAELRLVKTRIHFTVTNDNLYVCMPSDEGVTNEYLFAELKVEEGRAVVWAPDNSVFEEWVERGLLKKTEAGDDLKLETPASKVLKLVSTNSTAFNYKEPILLRKLK